MNKQFLLLQTNDHSSIMKDIVATLYALPRDKAWQVEIKPYLKTRTNAQNRSLWGVAYPSIASQTKNDPEDLHRYFLGERFGWRVIDVFGQKRRVPMRTSSSMTTEEFNDFYTFIQQRAAEAGYYVPDPNEERLIVDHEICE